MVFEWKKRAVRTALACVAVTSVFVTVPQAAQAVSVGGNCYAYRGEIEVFGPNAIYVRAYCTGLTSVSKARGVLDISGNPDEHTEWFTDLNVYHYSGTYRCIPGTCNNVRAEIAHR